MTGKRIALVACLAAVALGGGYFGYSRLRTNGAAAVEYETASFQRQGLEVRIEATGVVEPRNRIEIKPPIGGRIDEVLVTEGQAVRKGDVIARMNSTERAALLDAARARGPAVLTKWEDVYKATPLIAPLDGTIIARNTEPGQTVTAQDAVLVLSDRLSLTARVDETDIGRVRVGQKARITLDAYPDATVTGTVRQIAYEAITVNNVTVYTVEVEPSHVPDYMKSGMTAAVGFLVAEAQNVLTLPSDAVFVEGGKNVVLVDDGNAVTPPERWRVLTGLSGGGCVEILAGLDGTERVVRQAFKLQAKKATGTSPFIPSRRR